MVFLGLEKPVEYGAQQIFDPTMANMVLQAQQQYNEAARKEYERGFEDFDKFTTKYGDFISPFAKDMARYGEMIGGIQNVVDQAYKDGVDLLRSPEGRMLVHRLTNSINPAEFNTMRSNAKMGYAYLDAVQKLRAQGKYSEAQELFDIMQNGGLGFDKNGNKITDFSQFSTEGNGGFNTFNRSPIEAVTLQDLTKSHYAGRQARVLNQQDFNDPRLKGKGYNWNPRYEWSGYLRSDLLKNAPGAILSLSADPRFAFFKEEARQMVMARGETPTEAAVQRQLEENIADANTWALIDPTRKADEFAKMAQQAAYARQLEGIRAANDRQIAQIKANGNGDVPDGGYSATTNMAADAEGTLRGQLVNYSDSKKIDAPNREFGQIGNLFMDTILNPNRYSDSQKKYIANRAKQLGIDQLVLSGDPRKARSVEINRKISIGLEGVADEISKISNGSSWYNKSESVNKMNNILHDVSSNAPMSTVNGILKEFGAVSEDGGITLSTNYKRLCGVGSVMTDLLSRANADGRKHSKVDAALKHFQKSGNLKYSVNSWTAGAFDSRNNTDDWFPDNKVYATGNVVAGDKYYYIEVSNDPTDNSECCWFKVERNSERNGGINQVLSSITQKVDDNFLHEYSHTNVLGNPQSVVQKHNK